MNKRFTKTNVIKSRKGMTLAEVLVALTLLSLIIFVFTPTFLAYFKGIRAAGTKTQNTYERASIMERLVANKNGLNDEGYESPVASVPLVLKSSNTCVVDFSSSTYDDVKGALVSENLNRGDSYATFYANSTSAAMVCFPSSLTDDFLTKDIRVVLKGDKFDNDAYSKDQQSGYHFEVYNTNSSGVQVKVDPKYYDIAKEADGNDGYLAKFTFKGANNVISFENSPLYIKYCKNSVIEYEAKIEIDAPEIIMVGEKASDGNYYYYVTKGVDKETGKMEILAKKMTGDAALKSAMNDVEWVPKGRGDNGNGGVNQYGYYVMGGDAGQVRRFWRNETTGNYYWGGDNLTNFDRYFWMNDNGTMNAESYCYMTPELTTQAMFRSIYRSSQNIINVASNGAPINELFNASKYSGISGNDYKAVTTNFFTANVTNAQANKAFLTLGVVENINNGKYLYFGSDVDASKDEFNSAYSWLTMGQTKATKLNADGYKVATNYEYGWDNSLITITSVGAIKINPSKATGGNYVYTQTSNPYYSEIYPTKSYTLYCGRIPAVMDTFGWKTRAIIGGYNTWGHIGTLGVAFSTSADSWYPTGKFGDIHTTSTSLLSSAFSNDLTYRSLLRFINSANTTLYPNASGTNLYKAGVSLNGVTPSGIALPAEGNEGWSTAGDEVDITMGYLSQPYAIALNQPRAVDISGFTGSDWYFKNYSGKSGKYDHSFYSAGLRDNITMLDVKSTVIERPTSEGGPINVSLAVGYTVSFVFNDAHYLTRIGNVYNTGIVYLRATGGVTPSATASSDAKKALNSDTPGDLSSGKGWSLGKETNVFHQFFGSDQYYGNDEGGFLGIGKDGTKAIYGWDTDDHREIFNISVNTNKYPGTDSDANIPGTTKGQSTFGTNCHPLQHTECTTVNWGTTGDGKPQAMWGTDNGTLMSWFYDQEHPENSKITSVIKEFESYTWFKNIAASKGDAFYDYPSVKAGVSSKFGFISTLTCINDVCCADDNWVVAGVQSFDNSISPSNICASGGTLPSGPNWKPYTGNGEHASYVNVKYCADRTNNLYLWRAVKIADQDNVNITQLSYNQGIWYAFGYIDTNRNGKNDLNENAVLYYSVNPSEVWEFCKTKTDANSDAYITNPNGAMSTAALTFNESTGNFDAISLSGINSGASQG